MGLLIRGSVGEAVKALQENLTALGYEVDADGIYGANTEAQVRSFQDAYGLDADGKAGVNTMSKISELLIEIANQQTGETGETDGDGENA
ncbi:Hypothetical protein A7982_02756 [Minicystis rosea]|nr:Hypothetical protein A7982_02756 [Minicystis rosea]